MKLIEDNSLIQAKCNECHNIHISYAGRIGDEKGDLAHYLFCKDPNNKKHFLLAIKLIADNGSIAYALNIVLNEKAVMTYIDKFPLELEEFDWVKEILPRSKVLENKIDRHVIQLFNDFILTDDSRVKNIYKNWTESE